MWLSFPFLRENTLSHRSQAWTLLAFEETRGIAETSSWYSIKGCLLEAQVLRNLNSASFMSGQQKERRSLSLESLGGSKLCVEEADKAKSKTAWEGQSCVDGEGCLVTHLSPRGICKTADH